MNSVILLAVMAARSGCDVSASFIKFRSRVLARSRLIAYNVLIPRTAGHLYILSWVVYQV